MRSEYFAFLRVGATVRVAATCFDKPSKPRFSTGRFGELLQTPLMINRARRMMQTTCMVEWDDAEIRELDFEHIELHGDSLRAAETRIRAREEGNKQNRAGGSRRVARDLGERFEAVEVVENESDDDEEGPLIRMAPEPPPAPEPPSAPPGDSVT